MGCQKSIMHWKVRCTIFQKHRFLPPKACHACQQLILKYLGTSVKVKQIPNISVGEIITDVEEYVQKYFGSI